MIGNLTIKDSETGAVLVKSFSGIAEGTSLNVAMNPDGSATVSFTQPPAQVTTALEQFFTELFEKAGLIIGNITITLNQDNTITLSF